MLGWQTGTEIENAGKVDFRNREFVVFYIKFVESAVVP